MSAALTSAAPWRILLRPPHSQQLSRARRRIWRRRQQTRPRPQPRQGRRETAALSRKAWMRCWQPCSGVPPVCSRWRRQLWRRPPWTAPAPRVPPLIAAAASAQGRAPAALPVGQVRNKDTDAGMIGRPGRPGSLPSTSPPCRLAAHRSPLQKGSRPSARPAAYPWPSTGTSPQQLPWQRPTLKWRPRLTATAAPAAVAVAAT